MFHHHELQQGAQAAENLPPTSKGNTASATSAAAQPATDTRMHSPWRRSACDRCRSQKLRCVRSKDDDITTPCARCMRIQYPCFTGSPKPLGRLSSRASAGAPTEPKPNNDAVSRMPVTSMSPPESSSSSSTTSKMPQTENEPTPTHRNTPLPFHHPFIREDNTGDHLLDENMMLLTPDDVEGLDYLTLNMETGGHFDGHPDNGPGSSNVVPQLLHNFMLPAFASPPSPSAFAFDQYMDDDQDFEEVDAPQDEQMPLLVSRSQPTADPGVLLARLQETLSTQMVRLTTESWDFSVLSAAGTPAWLGVEQVNAETEAFNPLSSILRGIDKFLEIAELFKMPDNQSVHPSHHSSRSRHNPDRQSIGGVSNRVMKRMGRSSSLSCLSLCMPLNCVCPPPSIAETIDSSSSGGSWAIEQAVITNAQLLTLVSCYLQVVTIYNTIFSHLLHQLSQPMGHSQRPSQESNLILAGYSVPMHGALRMRLLVQLLEYQFEQIERALGLPKEYCVSTGQNRGNGSPGGNAVNNPEEYQHNTGLLSGREARTLLRAAFGLASEGADDTGALSAVASLREKMRRAHRISRADQ